MVLQLQPYAHETASGIQLGRAGHEFHLEIQSFCNSEAPGMNAMQGLLGYIL